ncbi:MAG: hypothetical protein H0U59_04110 [Gemmatimonadaceae bacterium]|nr:hypothetical protein [Gemmatimonadaceae bacterium]
MARFIHGDHDSDRALSFQGPLPQADKRTNNPVFAIFIGRVAQLNLSVAEVKSLRETLNAESLVRWLGSDDE